MERQPIVRRWKRAPRAELGSSPSSASADHLSRPPLAQWCYHPSTVLTSEPRYRDWGGQLASRSVASPKLLSSCRCPVPLTMARTGCRAWRPARLLWLVVFDVGVTHVPNCSLSASHPGATAQRRQIIHPSRRRARRTPHPCRSSGGGGRRQWSSRVGVAGGDLHFA